tara:strand:- start:30 stop:245 length:216 start_codon:yes stop_codon:yes gene_type:complete
MNMNKSNEVANSSDLVKSLVIELVRVNINYKHQDLESRIKNSDPNILNEIKNLNVKLYEMVQEHIMDKKAG